MTNALTLNDALADLPQLVTERLLLRKVLPDDSEAVFAYASDPGVTSTLSWDTHLSIDDSQAFISGVLEAYDRGNGATWAIVHLADKMMIGTIGFSPAREGQYVAEVGYVLARSHWRRGLMTEALSAALNFGFRHMGLRRIEAICRADNVASYRVMEKCGMSLDGILRDARYIKGQLMTIRLYSIVRSDYDRTH